MASTIARLNAISALLIVRQGGTDLAAFGPYRQVTADAAFAGKLRLIVQENHGGTGGFVRGIIESLDADATHVLLLDDDVRIEPAVLERLVALVGRLATPVTIGGQMLDLHRPCLLHASHETVAFRSLRLNNPCRDIDMGLPNAVDLFGRRHVSDYNAWWLCCIPAAVVRTIGLPLPMFIRHDDVEYGVRTIAAGFPLVTMPGVFVWHAPFSTKNITPSFMYYERRNFIIAAAVHRKASPLHLTLRHWCDAWAGLRRFRYDYCWALCRAVDDVVEGPEVVFSDIRTRHGRLPADQARLTLLTMTDLRHRGARHRRMRLARLLLLPVSGRNRAETALAMAARHLVVDILRTGLALLWRSRKMAAAYRREAAVYQGQAFWRDLLGTPPEPSRPA